MCTHNLQKVADLKIRQEKLFQEGISFSGDADAKSLFQNNWKGKGFGLTLTVRVTRRTGVWR